MADSMAKLRALFVMILTCWLWPVDGLVARDGDDIPLQVEIRTQLDFSRATTGSKGGGKISIDPVSGTRQLAGDVVDLGGSALAGTAIVTGEPGRMVRIDMPLSIRMTGTHGGAIEITNLRTNLQPGAKLDGFGKLEFAFGGDLRVDGSSTGTFRGRIPITAEYE
jgi:Domain of unknown function (DUF4402)